MVYFASVRATAQEIRRLIGSNVKRERQRQGLVQIRLAIAAGIDLSTLQRLEGGRMARLSTIAAVAGALDVPVWRLFKPAR